MTTVRGLFAAFALILLWLSSAARAQTSAPPPTQAEIQALFDAGKYPETLQKLARVLLLAGPAAASYDRYQLYMLRGDALLHTHQGPAALDAFAAARKEAKKPEEAALADAMQILIKHSPGLVYTTKPKAGEEVQKFNILDRVERKAAFAALYDELLAALAPQLKAAQEAKSLDLLLKFGQAVSPLRALELTVTGSNDQTKTMLKDLGDHASTLITTALTAMEHDVAAIDRSANEWVERVVPGGYGNNMPQRTFRKRGLSDADIRTLDNALATCERIPPAVRDLSAALSLDPDTFHDALAAADKLRTRAQTVRKADYSQTSTNGQHY